jgi:hypothetical protein
MDTQRHTIDLDWLVRKLPAELKCEIKNFTFLMQMEEHFDEDDLGMIAILFCADVDGLDAETPACWLTTLVSAYIFFFQM